MAVSPGDEPVYMQAAHARAAEMDISADQLLANYSERLRSSTYPTPSCITPQKVQACASGASLSEVRRLHLATCDECQALLQAVQPPSDVFAKLMEELRDQHSKANANSMTAGSTWFHR